MPTDSRRIPAPEKSVNPDLFVLPTKENSQYLDGSREDGRAESDVRPVYLKTGVVKQAKGSAYIELGKTKIICAVYGPRDIGRREEFQMTGLLKCEFKFAPFSCKQRRQHISDNEEMEYSQVLTQALEPAVRLNKFPKSQVDVYVTVLENDGGALAGAIIASSAALADASIEMFDVVTACGVRQAGKHLLLCDPTAKEEFSPNTSPDEMYTNHGSVIVALLPVLNQVSALLMTGVMDCDVVSEAVRQCTNAAQCLYPIVQKTISESIESTYAQNGS